MHPFLSSPEFQYLITQIVHPTIMNLGYEEALYAGLGTSFSIKSGKYIYFVSARHVWKNQGINSQNFRVLLRNNAWDVIFDQEAIFKEEAEIEDDLVILRAYPDHYDKLYESGMRWIDIGEIQLEETFSEDDTYIVTGYPEEKRDYHYETQSISAEISIFTGQRINPMVDGLYSLKIANSDIKTFNGISGSPVFLFSDEGLIFAGMTVLGVAESGIVNFIPAIRIAYYITRMQQLESDGIFI